MDIRKRLPAFASRDYRLWFFGQGISVIGTWLQNTGQAWLVLKLTDSPFKLGLVTSIQYLPSLFLSIFIGPIIDLFPKRTILLWTQSLFAVLAALLSWVCFAGHVQYWQVLAIAAVTGFVSAIDFPTRQSFISEQVEGGEAVVNAVALNNIIFNVARIVGPAIGGAMIALVGIPWTFLLNAASYLAVIAGLAAMRAGRAAVASSSGDFWGEIAKGWRYVVGDRVIMTLLVVAGAMGLFAYNFNILVPSFAKLRLGLGADGYGGLQSALGAGALVAAAIISLNGARISPTPARLFGSGLVLSASMVLVGLQRHPAAAALCLFACGLGMATFSTMSNTSIQMRASPQMRGRVMSAYNLVWVGTTPIGSLYVGIVSDRLGSAAGFWISGAICLAFLLAMILFVAPRAFKGVSSFTRP